jgi:tRNA-dihydrouridine synthase B
MSIPHPVQIGAISISPPLALAPMAGLTDSSFRRLILARGGCGLVVTEMINAAAFSPKALRNQRMLSFHPGEHPIAVQISGHDAAAMARAAALAQERGLDIVDINAGCPVRQVTGSGSGAALLRDLGRLEAILRAVRQAVTIPLTLKFRSGWDAASIVAREVATLAEACGCAAITLHPRTRAQGYGGRADWRLIGEVVAAVRIPVFASGDVRSAADARRCFEETGCSGLMVARQALANPWILAQIAADLAGQEPPEPTPADHYYLLLEYLDLLGQSIPNEPGRLGKIKQLVGKLRLGLPGVAAFRQEVMHSHSVELVRGVIDTYFGAVAGNKYYRQSSHPDT